ncbi:Endothelial cell-specific chemotaxis regulator [Myotis davidii]|uniref:Endothelial cell-specific chemotaxis regulator n=1 Tax=Myotis davidii TaxID=225400 RepID=L5LBI5_MYODS|nr:Endothelial cell-specific chemotaxis regulator [Myotis davidii]
MSEQVLTVAAFGVISFIVILVVVVIILVSVVSLRFKCQKNKESEDPQKPGSSGLSESCSAANGEKDSITLISMKNINMNNSKGCRSAEKDLITPPRMSPVLGRAKTTIPTPQRRKSWAHRAMVSCCEPLAAQQSTSSKPPPQASLSPSKNPLLLSIADCPSSGACRKL